MDEQSLPDILTRYAAPGQYDHAPFGTLCRVTLDAQTFHIYMQVSKNPEEPLWELMEK